MIDGGKGQLAAAVEAMAGFELPRVAVISLAKRVEEVFVPGRSAPVVLDRNSPGSSCCSASATRPTGSRSGSTASAAAPRASTRSSTACPASGPARRRRLMLRFETADALVNATRDELESVPGVPAKVGRGIYAALHRTD